jgi:hypothetical protein
VLLTESPFAGSNPAPTAIKPNKMNILYINDFKGVDYLNDNIFHGGRSLFGEKFVESKDAWYMYDDLSTNDKSSLYGNGFTVAGKLPRIPIDTNNIQEKIKDKFFDLIIYGSIHRNLSYINDVIKTYKSNEVIFLDGEDETNIREDLIPYGVYFKRELIDEHSNSVHPISFSIPKELISIQPNKEKMLATTSSAQTGYIFHNEEDYYKDYKKSYFALTKKKAGWDCLRHYEIIMNGALPLFYDLHNLPKTIMTHWNKELLEESLHLFWDFKIHKQELDLNAKSISDIEYNNLRNSIIENLNNNLTTEKMFNYILSKL